MNTNLITAEDHSLFLNCLKSILTSKKEYTILLTKKNGKYVAQYQEDSIEKNIEFTNNAMGQKVIKPLDLTYQRQGNPGSNTLLKINQFLKDNDVNNFIKYDTGSIETKKNIEERINLTRREIEVVTLVAKEFTTQEIADQLFLSKHTIESYRKNLISKLNVRNLAGLTKYALKMQYINLDTVV